MHGARVALACRELVPGLGRLHVALDADAFLVEIADAVLSRRETLVSGLLVPFRGPGHVFLCSAPFGIAIADFVERLGIARGRGFAQRYRAGIDGDGGNGLIAGIRYARDFGRRLGVTSRILLFLSGLRNYGFLLEVLRLGRQGRGRVAFQPVGRDLR